MRKVLIIVLSIVSIMLVTCLVINFTSKKKSDEVLSLRMLNNYTVGDNERRISHVLYFTRDNIYNNKEIVNSVSFVDGETESILKLKINNIKKTNYSHKYKGKKYYSYVYDLSIPQTNVDMDFNNAKLEIISEDHMLYVPIGIVSIKYDKNLSNNKPLVVNNLEGSCNYKPYQTLSTVKMNLENKTNNNITIKKMNMGGFVDLVKETNNEVTFNNENTTLDYSVIGYMNTDLTLTLSYKARYILKESYIEIIYNDTESDKVTYIDTFNYYDNGYALPEADDLILTLAFKV